MKYARDYRYEAHQKTAPQIGNLVVIFLIFTVISALINLSIKTGEVQNIMGVELEMTSQPLSFLAIFVAGPFAYSLNMIAKKVDQEEKVEVKDLFYGFKNFGRSFVANIVMDLYIALWSLISFGIIGIIKSFSYSMTYFLLEENKDLTINEAITLSRELMNGYKWRLFCLTFSYIGWYILSIFTLGILNLWIEPRVNQAKYIFFKEIYENSGRKVSSLKQNVIEVDSYTNNYSE